MTSVWMWFIVFELSNRANSMSQLVESRFCFFFLLLCRILIVWWVIELLNLLFSCIHSNYDMILICVVFSLFESQLSYLRPYDWGITLYITISIARHHFFSSLCFFSCFSVIDWKRRTHFTYTKIHRYMYISQCKSMTVMKYVREKRRRRSEKKAQHHIYTHPNAHETEEKKNNINSSSSADNNNQATSSLNWRSSYIRPACVTLLFCTKNHLLNARHHSHEILIDRILIRCAFFFFKILAFLFNSFHFYKYQCTYS